MTETTIGAGRMFGPYRLVELIGRGGMGEVWRAVDTAKDREVAVKILGSWLRGEPGFDVRFRRESRLAARLNAPNIIPIHDFGEIGEHLFLDMQLVRGSDLGEVIARDGRLDPGRTAHIVDQVADALDVAHDAKLLHRDVKPSNVLVTSRRTFGEFVYLIDFGIAHGDESTTSTMTGGIIGSLAYMAPERFSGGGDLRSDVYSLACVAYECLAGGPPFRKPEGAHAVGFFYNAHTHLEPPSLVGAGDGCSEALDAVVRKGMAKDPGDRFESAGALAVAFRRAIPAAAAPPDRPPSDGREEERREHREPGRWRRSGLVAAIVTAVVAGGLFALPRAAPDPPVRVGPAEGRLLGTIPTTGTQTLPVLSPDGTRLYIGDATSTVLTVDVPSLQVRDSDVLEQGAAHAYNTITTDRRGVAYVLCNDSVRVVDPTVPGDPARIPVDEVNLRGAVTPDAGKFYLVNRIANSSNGGPHEVSVIDLGTGRITSRLLGAAPDGGGWGPQAVTISEDGRTAFVDGDGDLVQIDTATDTVRSTMKVEGLYGFTPLDDGRRLLAGGEAGLSVVDPTTNSVSLLVADTQLTAFFSPGSRYAYLVSGEKEVFLTVVDLDTAQPLARYGLKGSVSTLVGSDDGRVAYVGYWETKAVDVIGFDLQ